MLNGEVADRISDLTESLNRTTEILSTADRMMDHYRNLNREQEFEIARLQEDLKSRNRSQRQNHEDYESDHFKIKKTSQKEVKKQKVYLTSSESSEDEFQNQRANSHKRSYSSKVKFKDNESDIFETTLNDLNKRQEHLEKELRKERQRRVDDMEQLDQLVSIKKELTSTRRKDETDDILNVRLTEIQRQLEDEHWEWKKQQQGISAEVKAIKEIIKESVTPRSIEPSSKANHSESDETILSYKKKIEKGKEIIKKLKDELHIKNRENHVFETTVDEIHAVGQMKSNQLRLLEEQLQHEKSSKSKILDELEKLKLELAASEKQRTELLIDLSTTKNETQFCKRNYEEEVADLKLLLDKNNKSKQKCLSHIEKLEIELNNRELLLQRRNHQLNDLTDRINNLEKEKQDLQMRSQESQSHIDLQKDLELTKSKLLNTQRSCRDLIKAKKDLKEKAISTIKDLRRKCSELENHANELLEANKQKSIEISKREDSQSKDGELNISKMKKEMLKVESLQMRIEDYRLKVESLTSEKAYLEENLLHAKQDAKSVIHYKKEIEKLHELTSTLKAEVSNEKQKRKELKNLLQESYEVAVSKRKETSSLLQHVQDEKSSHAELVEKLKKDHVHEMNEIIKNEEEKLKTIETLYTKLEEKFKSNEEKYEEKENGWRVLETEYQLLLEEKDKKLRVMDENNRLLREEKEQKTRISEEENRLLLDEKVKELLKIKEENFLLNEKVHILGEENLRVRKRYQLMKKDLVGKLNTALAIQSKPALHVDQPSEWNEERFKLLLKSVLNVLSRDVENIHNLLTEEEDQNLPAREIPAGIHDECKDRVERFQEHLHTCHSIAKSLKQRYHQQKTLIQRARLKIKSLMGELENSRSQLKVEVNNYEKKCLEVEKERENDKVVLEEYKKKVQILQSRVKGLSSHLEKCTRALHGSIAMASDQKFVIDEIDQLKNEHREYQELDERFYKSEEQREVISEQLNEAKNSLTQIKQSSLDATLFSNKMIQTFGSLSPTRKRKLLPFHSPKKFTEPIGKTFAKTIYSEIESTPIKDSDLLNDTEMSLLDGALFLNPMSMNDEDFNNLFIPTKSPTTNSRK